MVVSKAAPNDKGETGRVAFISGAAWKGVTYGCTVRAGGVSRGPWEGLNLGLHVSDEPDAVHENRRRLCLLMPSNPCWLDQVHGTGVIDVDTFEPTADLPRGDAAITRRPGRVLAILTADCAPVVISDLDGQALGVAHAGWRGLAGGVLETTLAALQARLPQARGWRAWVGPCIGWKAFEVGQDVLQAFGGVDSPAADFFRPRPQPGKWEADLAGLARHRLEIRGVYPVEGAGLCTYERADLFYSHRRAAPTGRMATVAWLAPNPAPVESFSVPTYPN